MTDKYSTLITPRLFKKYRFAVINSIFFAVYARIARHEVALLKEPGALALGGVEGRIYDDYLFNLN